MNIADIYPQTLLDFPGYIATMIFLPTCNLKCPYCYNVSLLSIENSKNIDQDEVISWLSQRTKLIEGVVISGGEPTMWNDLPQFLEKIKKLGLFIKVDSNGTNPKLLRKLLDSLLLDYLAIDFKMPLNRYTEQYGIPQDTILESIHLLRNVHGELRTTIHSSLLSYTDLVVMHDELKDLNALWSNSKGYNGPTWYWQLFSKISSDILDPSLLTKENYSADDLEKFKRTLSPYKNITVR